MARKGEEMSVAKVKKAVKEFLGNSAPEVLSIKGSWGVGKTYFWNSCIKNASQQDLHFKNYAYVSLFGITSLDELKFAIFQNVIDKSLIGEPISLETFKVNTQSLFKKLGRNVSSIVMRLPGLKDFGSEMKSAAFLTIRETLICFDDFERRGKSLSAKDFLGLVSLLKEQQCCKVILVFSDSNLDEESKGEYEELREKVIDTEVLYSPTSLEAAEIIFDEKIDFERQLIALTVSLNISNIRILSKIHRAVKSVIIFLEEFEKEVVDQALRSLVLFGWCYYTHGDESLKIDYVKTKFSFYGSKEYEGKKEKEKEWDALLREYGYGYTDEFDFALIAVIEAGYVDEENLLEKAKLLNAQVKASKPEKSFWSVWSLYHDSFKDNEEEIVSAFEESLRENAGSISPNNLSGTISLLRDLGKDDLANELIDVYIEKNVTREKIFDLDLNSSFGEITDVEIVTRFNRKLNEIKEFRNAKDVLDSIAGGNSWASADEEVLSTATVDDYYELFKNLEGEQLSSYVNTCLKFGRSHGATATQNKISENAKKALERIGSESKLNKLRVKKFGIVIKDDELKKIK